MFGDDRITVGVVLIGLWVVSWLIRRRQQSRERAQADPVATRRPREVASGTLQRAPVLATVSASLAEPAPATVAQAPAPRPSSAPARSKKARRKHRR